jgi:hypothetical protein
LGSNSSNITGTVCIRSFWRTAASVAPPVRITPLTQMRDEKRAHAAELAAAALRKAAER